MGLRWFWGIQGPNEKGRAKGIASPIHAQSTEAEVTDKTAPINARGNKFENPLALSMFLSESTSRWILQSKRSCS